jgi:hypothetical protein
MRLAGDRLRAHDLRSQRGVNDTQQREAASQELRIRTGRPLMQRP